MTLTKEWLEELAEQWAVVMEKRDALISKLYFVLLKAGAAWPEKYYTRGLKSYDILEDDLEINPGNIKVRWEISHCGCCPPRCLFRNLAV